jgi:4-amino-4-deoxy-L-arabinose transferase-like glycosyltransferase
LYSFTKRERWALAGLLLLLIPALLVNLGIVPLYVEEPRRATVALEMLLRGNWIIPTIDGQFYYLKPPVFNWLLASVYSLAGESTELNTRLITVVSLLVFGLIIFTAGKKYVSLSFGVLSSMLFMTVAGNLFFNSLLAEIDIFYSMVTYAALICMFHLHRQKKYLSLFLVVYFLGAVGTLTKGLPSVLFTGLSLLVFFIVNKEFRKLFSLSHFAGILLYLVIVGGYFLAYNRHGDAIKYLLNLSFESGKRLSGNTPWDYLRHMLLYPLDTLMNLLPAAVLLIFTFRRSFLKVIRENSFMKFALLMLIVHFPVYWLPPGGKQRYIIMLYPFIIQVFTYFFLIYFNSEKSRFRAFNIIVTLALALGTAACLVPLFVSKMTFIPHLLPICFSIFALMVLVTGFHLKNQRYTIISLIAAMIIMRFFFNFTVLPVRAAEGDAPTNMKAAFDIAGITKGKPVSIYSSTYFPMQSVYYLERERNEIVPVKSQVMPGEFQIVEKVLLQKYSSRRNDGNLETNPFRQFSDPYSGDDFNVLMGYDYKTVYEFQLQKCKYILLVPEQPHQRQGTPAPQ